MTVQPQTFPNIEKVLVSYLKTLAYFKDSTLTVNGTPTVVTAGTPVFLPTGLGYVSTDLPVDYNGTQLVCRVDRIGGAANWPQSDHPNVEISCWGPDKSSASDFCDAVRLSCTWMVMAGFNFSAFGARLSNAAERLGPEWLDEPGYEPAGRYRFEISVDVRNG